MADMTRLPALADIPVLPKFRDSIGVASWNYTTSTTGALEIHTDNLGLPGGHNCYIYRIEVDTIGAQGNTVATVYLEFPSGHDLESLSFELHSWTFQGDTHEVVPLTHVLPFVNEMILRIAIVDVDSGVEIILSAIGEWK